MRYPVIPHTSLNPKRCNPHMQDFQIISRRQIEFGIYIRNYRRIHELSQTQFAKIASYYLGDTDGDDLIQQANISSWENFKVVPCERYMNAVLAAMNIELDDLD